MANVVNPLFILAGQQPTLITKNITANGDYSASDEGADGYSSVSVNVPPTLFRKMADRYITSFTAGDLGNITRIGLAAFQNCTSLTSASLPNSVTRIQANAFYNCNKLTTLDVGSGITRIDTYAFTSCTSLTSFTIRATTPPQLDSTTAFDSTNNCPIYVPAESVNAYKAATNWASLASRIQAIPV